MITAEIIKDSISPEDVRLTTFVLTYPRFIHAEFMTHRMFSRNASSSRAIPVKKQIQMVMDNPAIPIAFLKNQKGIQGGDALVNQTEAVDTWLAARDFAAKFAEHFATMDVHKQYANRILEPWAHITVVCTATDWANFFALRIHPAAMPEICELATQMHDRMQASTPSFIDYGGWHLPFIDAAAITETEDKSYDTKISQIAYSNSVKARLVERSVARCARVSYLNHDGKASTHEEDIALWNRLVGAQPIHASPTEHQAMPASLPHEYFGNLKGWVQYRKFLVDENVTVFTR